MPSVGEDYRPTVIAIDVSWRRLVLVIVILVLVFVAVVLSLTNYGSWLGATYGGRSVTVITDPDGLYSVEVTAVPGECRWEGCWVDVAVVLGQGVTSEGPVQRFTGPFSTSILATQFALTLSRGSATRSLTFSTGYPGPFEKSPVKIYGFRGISVVNR